jgi:hypothetical protein
MESNVRVVFIEIPAEGLPKISGFSSNAPQPMEQGARLMYALRANQNHILENPMVELIPSQDAVMQILKRTGAFREGHFRLSQRKALATLLSRCRWLSLLRHGARAGSGAEPEVSTRKGHLQSVAKIS